MPDTGGFSGARRAVRVCNTTAKRRPQEWILLKKSVHMVMTLEDEFGIEVPDDAIESLRTVGDVVNFVDSHAQN